MCSNATVINSLETQAGQQSDAPGSSSPEPGAIAATEAWVLTIVAGDDISVQLAATREIAERLALGHIEAKRWAQTPAARVGPLDEIDPEFALDYWWGAVDVMSSPECLIRGEADSQCIIQRQPVITAPPTP